MGRSPLSVLRVVGFNLIPWAWKFRLFFVPIALIVIAAACYATPPVADFTWVEDTWACGRVQFTSTASDPDGGTVLWFHWNFGFGSFVGLPEGAENPLIVFPGSAGDTYNVTLRVTKPGGESTEITKVVTLSCTGNHAPWLQGVQVTQPADGTSAHFYVDYYDPDGDDPVLHQLVIDQVGAYQMWELSGSPDGVNGATYRCDVTGLQPGTYSYSFEFEDPEGVQALAYRTTANLVIAGDTSPPTPNPMTWHMEPDPVSTTEIDMMATPASDASGVEYYFDETTGNGHDSGWQSSDYYTDSGLTPGVQCCYRVRARDTSSNQNATDWSIEQCATTPASLPPAQIWDFNASDGEDGKSTLSWTNPSDADLVRC